MDVVLRLEHVGSSIFSGVEGGNPVKGLLGQLHQPLGTGGGDRLGIKTALRLNDGVDQVRVQLELGGLPLHQVGIALGVQEFHTRLYQPGTEKHCPRRQENGKHEGHEATFLHRLGFSNSCSNSSKKGAKAAFRSVPGPFSTRKSARLA